MKQYENTQNALNNYGVSDPARSRIQADIEMVKILTDRIHDTAGRIIAHARAMGYYEPTPDAKNGVPQPVITTMADALRALESAVDHCSGSLNVFD